MKTNDKYYMNRITPQEGAKIEVSQINNSRFVGTKESFINLNGNRVYLYKTTDGSIYDVKEIAKYGGYGQYLPKLHGCYEVPDDSPRRADGNFLLVERQYKYPAPGGFSDIYEDQWSVRFMAASPNSDGYYGGVDQTISGMSGAELREIVEFSDKKHGQTLNLKIRKKDSGYRVVCENINCILENSDDIIEGRISETRVIPSARDLAFQGSSDHKTQISKGVWVG
jgi:hypothetical protein